MSFVVRSTPRGRRARRGTSVGVIAGLAALAVGASPAWAVDLTAPALVKGMVTSADKTRVKLDWTNSAESDLAGYLVYRSNTSDGPYTRLTAAPRTSSDFPDYSAQIGLPS